MDKKADCQKLQTKWPTVLYTLGIEPDASTDIVHSVLPPPVPTVPRVVAVSPQMRLVEDNPSSLSLVEIYKQRCAKKGIEHDNPISRYYDRLATVQARGTQASHQVRRRTHSLIAHITHSRVIMVIKMNCK